MLGDNPSLRELHNQSGGLDFLDFPVCSSDWVERRLESLWTVTRTPSRVRTVLVLVPENPGFRAEFHGVSPYSVNPLCRVIRDLLLPLKRLAHAHWPNSKY